MFVFYDTETTGLDQNFNQILQIALVFTDGDMNILSSKKLECRNSPWVVPSPGALLTTGFVPDDLKFNKLSNYEMMQEVDKWVRGQHWPITIAGYNSVSYDDPILAQNLYQGLMPANLTSAKADPAGEPNGHLDVLLLVKATALYMPGVLKLDETNFYGQPSMNLRSVSQQNGVSLSNEDAHDAMNDIKATVGVAKLLRKAAPQLWDQMMKLSTTEGVDAFLSGNAVLTYADAGVFKEKMTAAVATPLAGDAAGGPRHALFDLRVDPAPYLNMTPAQLKAAMAPPEGEKSPFALIRKDKQPILMPMELSDAVLAETDDTALYAARARALQANQAFRDNVAQALTLLQQEKEAALPPKRLPETQVDCEIASPAREKIAQWVKEFQGAADWPARAALVEDFRARFKDELVADPSLSRFVKLAGRLVYEHAPEALSDEKRAAMKKHIACRILSTDPDAPYMTIAKARKELEKIEWQRAQKGDKKWTEVTDSEIRALKLYYTALEKEYAPYAPRPANDNKAHPHPHAIDPVPPRHALEAEPPRQAIDPVPPKQNHGGPHP